MQDINTVSIIGRLTRDIDVAYLGNGTACGRLNIAVNESRKSGNEWTEYANYFEVTLWGKSAENLKPYLTKGKQIVIDGHLQQQRWEKDGQKNSKVVIIADNIQLVGGRESNSTGSETQQENNGGDFPEDIPF